MQAALNALAHRLADEAAEVVRLRNLLSRREVRGHFANCGHGASLEAYTKTLDVNPYLTGVMLQRYWGESETAKGINLDFEKRLLDECGKRGKYVWAWLQWKDFKRTAQLVAPPDVPVFVHKTDATGEAGHSAALHQASIAERLCHFYYRFGAELDQHEALAYADTSESAPGNAAVVIPGFREEQERALRLLIETLSRAFKRAQPVININYFPKVEAELVQFAHSLGVGLGSTDDKPTPGNAALQPGQPHIVQVTAWDKTLNGGISLDRWQSMNASAVSWSTWLDWAGSSAVAAANTV